MKLLKEFNKSVHKLNFSNMLHNRILLYVLCVLSIIQIIMLGNQKNYNLLIMFVVIGLLTSYFNNNMIVILAVTLLSIYVLKTHSSFKEGNTGMNDQTTPNTDQANTDQANTDQANTDQANTDQANTDQANTDQANTDQANTDQVNTDSSGTPASNTTDTAQNQLNAGTSNGSTNERTQLYNELVTDFQDFQAIQQKLLTTMQEIDPLLQKAETFVNKFEGYKTKAAKLNNK